jgi:hypothetical protein
VSPFPDQQPICNSKFLDAARRGAASRPFDQRLKYNQPLKTDAVKGDPGRTPTEQLIYRPLVESVRQMQ